VKEIPNVFQDYLKGFVITAQHLGQHPVQQFVHELWLEVWGLCSGFGKEKKRTFLGMLTILVNALKVYEMEDS